MLKSILTSALLLTVLAGCDDAELQAALAQLRDARATMGVGELDYPLRPYNSTSIRRVVSFGARAVPGLSTLLKTGTVVERRNAAVAAAGIGRDAAALESALLACARDPELEDVAIPALVYIAPRSRAFGDLVLARFQEPLPKSHVIFAAMYVMGPLSQDVRDRLVRLATDLPEPHEITWEAMQRDRKAAEDARQRLALGADAAWALGVRRRESAHEVPALVRVAARGGYQYFRALARIDTLPAREALERFLQSENRDESRNALRALSEIEPVPEIVWTTIEAGLASKDPGIALGMIRSMGVRAGRLMPKVLPWLSHKETRWGALKAVGAMGNLSPEARLALQALLEDESEGVRREARRLLEEDGA